MTLRSLADGAWGRYLYTATTMLRAGRRGLACKSRVTHILDGRLYVFYQEPKPDLRVSSIQIVKHMY
jgi:hypothetical protein